MFREYLELPMDVWKPRTQEEEYAARDIMEERKGHFAGRAGEPLPAERKRKWRLIAEDMQKYPTAYKELLGAPPFRIEPVTIEELWRRLPSETDPKRTVMQLPDKPAEPGDMLKAKSQNGELEIIRSDNGEKPVGVRELLM